MYVNAAVILDLCVYDHLSSADSFIILSVNLLAAKYHKELSLSIRASFFIALCK